MNNKSKMNLLNTMPLQQQSPNKTNQKTTEVSERYPDLNIATFSDQG